MWAQRRCGSRRRLQLHSEILRTQSMTKMDNTGLFIAMKHWHTTPPCTIPYNDITMLFSALPSRHYYAFVSLAMRILCSCIPNRSLYYCTSSWLTSSAGKKGRREERALVICKISVGMTDWNLQRPARQKLNRRRGEREGMDNT